MVNGGMVLAMLGVVWIMKGPAYVADAYPLVDAEEPGHDRPRTSDSTRPR